MILFTSSTSTIPGILLFSLILGLFHLPCNAFDIHEIQKKIQSDSSKILSLIGNHLGWNDNLQKYYHAFENNLFVDYVGQEPIFIYELTFTDSWGQFGNRLGHYFEVISFCKTAGIHFIGFMRSDREQPAAIIADAVPITILHPNPAANREQALANLQKIPYYDWPWIEHDCETFKNIDQISQLTLKIADQMQSHFHGDKNKGLHVNTFDKVINGKSNDETLPYIPYAVILTRCADLIRAGHFDEYGLLNFNLYPMIIPREASEIYILAEPLNYGGGHELCADLTNRMADFLVKHYPHATIGIRRGHAHDGFVQLSKARYVVCSPSTFCLWPGIANKDNQVFYQPSQLTAGGKQIFMHLNFHWISYPKMYSHMMSEEDEKNPLLASQAIAEMLSTVQPRCEKCNKYMDNSRVKTVDWDCGKN